MMNKRFDGYNREDFHYPRSTREVYGENLTRDDFEDIYTRGHKLDVLVGVASVIIAIVFFSIVW